MTQKYAERKEEEKRGGGAREACRVFQDPPVMVNQPDGPGVFELNVDVGHNRLLHLHITY